MNQEESIQHAKEYLENILTFFGLNVSIEASYDGEYIELKVPSTDANSILIGRNAENLRSLQFLVATMLRNQDAAITKVNVDIADYKQQRAEKLEQQAEEWIEEVRRTGDTKVLHLNAADRRTVHGVAARYSDITSLSEGEGRDRKLIIAQISS